MERAGSLARCSMTGAQRPCDCSRAVGALWLRSMAVVSTPSNGGASARTARLVMKGMPPLRDHVALFPNPAPSRLMTEERKAAWCERSRWRDGAMLRMGRERQERGG